jgi:perosamine synthetase
MSYLIPRLNYCYTFRDLLVSVRGIFSAIDETPVRSLFQNDKIYFINSGRTGLRMILNSLDLPADARIGVQVYNCRSVFKAIDRTGYSPVFIDTGKDFCIDTGDLKRKAENIDALIVTHLFGIPADVEGIKKITGNKPVIEDCAHSFMSHFNNRLTGTSGDCSVFSYGSAKFPSAGKGGIVMINNKRYLENFLTEYKKLKKPGIAAEISGLFRNIIFSVVYSPWIYGLFTVRWGKIIERKLDPGGKSRFRERLAYRTNTALFFDKLKRIDSLLQKQKRNCSGIAGEWNRQNNGTISIPPGSNCFMVPVWIENERDQILSLASENHTEFGTHFRNSISWASEYGYKPGSCPVAEKTCTSIVTIPCHYNYPGEGIEKITELITQLHKKQYH